MRKRTSFQSKRTTTTMHLLINAIILFFEKTEINAISFMNKRILFN